ncbi:MAG: cupin domain-containing protein [Methanothrix sp.]|jgi:mannose-6-phosphate isomerase-like protein (cupin superfamily)
MFIKDLAKCPAFTALDNTHLCELMHPSQDGVNIPYSIAFAEVMPGESSLIHRLKTSSEVYFILDGVGEMHIDEEQAQVSPGQAIFIAPGSWQFIRNIGSADLRFLCIVYPKWHADDEELREAGM